MPHSGLASNVPPAERLSLIPVSGSTLWPILLDQITDFLLKLDVMSKFFPVFVDFLTVCFPCLNVSSVAGTCLSLPPGHPQSLEQVEGTWQMFVE